MKIKCLTCDTIVQSSTRLVGCCCDSDAPTWCALDGIRVLTVSQSRWEAVDD